MNITDSDFDRGFELAMSAFGDKYSASLIYATVTEFFRNDVDCTEEYFLEQIDESGDEIREMMLARVKLAYNLSSEIWKISAECKGEV
jgi:hypothetical protein